MINIIGAGMSGLLAAYMLRYREPIIYEAQPSLPNNHHSVLRFRSPLVGDVTNMPFRKVTLIKTHHPWRNPVADALAYSYKNGGTYRSDRSITAGYTVADRWIAPPGFISRLAFRIDAINFGSSFKVNGASSAPIISTMPMQNLMRVLNYPEPVFNYASGFSVKVKINNCDAYVSLLVPDPALSFSRISLTGDELIVEGIGDSRDQLFAKLCVGAALHLLGIPEDAIASDIAIKDQPYAKILPIDDDARKQFMFWATDKFNIYSLGRFATWRPHLLLDDLVQDIRLIDSWIDNKYKMARHR